MTNSEIFAVLRPIIMRVTGVPECILADPNAPAPNGAYCSVRPRQGIRERGQANVYNRNVPGNFVRTEVRAQIIATCDINFYRGNAQEYAEKLMQCNKRPDVSMDLFKAKLGWGGTDAINNLTALQSANYEQRAQITVRLMYETSDIVDINNILSASVAVSDENANILQTVVIP